MFKKKLLCPLLMMLLVVITAVTVSPPVAAGNRLVDIQEATWAEQAIVEMCAGGIITGYPDGYFRPYNNVTRVEAVTMLIRVMGLEERAKEKENAYVDYNTPPDLTWGRGYIIMGVERGMLDKHSLDRFLVSQPATRLEVAALLYHALDLEAGGGSLTFDDAGQIPADYRECVAAMVKNNIMEGLPGNVFGPNDNINRAQMAVLLTRLMDKGFADPYPNRRYNGTLVSIDPSGLFLAMRVGDYGILNKLIDSGCGVYSNGMRTALLDLAAGDEVTLVLDDNDSVTFIKAKQAIAADEHKGAIKSLFSIGGDYWLALTDIDGTERTRYVAQGVRITHSGSPIDISYLSIGDYIKIIVVDNAITEIDLIDSLDLSAGSLEGEITDIVTSDPYSITIRNNKGDKIRYTVVDDVTVRWGGSRLYFDDLYRGDRVKLELDGRGRVNYIEIIDESTSDDLEGEITDITTSSPFSITIRNGKGDKKQYTVIGGVTVRWDGARLYFDDLYRGDQVRLELDGRDRVVYIEVIDEGKSKDLQGEITDIDTGDPYGITIRSDKGERKTYTVSDNVTVRRDGARLYFDDLYRGDRVKLELDGRNRVTYIEVINEGKSNDLEGEISDIVISGSYSITILNDKGDRKKYTVIDNVTVRWDGAQVNFYDLYRGDRVRLELDSKDRVTYIEVIKEDRSIIAGTITRLDTSKPQWLAIENKYDRVTSYDIARYATFTRDGARIDLNQIVIGSEVELEIKKQEVESIKVTNDRNITVEGTVVNVDTNRQRITIKQSSGNEFVYYAGDVFRIGDRDRGYIRPGDIQRGWDVEMEIKDGKIYKVTFK